MKITKQHLKQIIKEEVETLLQEKTWYPSWEGAVKAQDPDRMSLALKRSLEKTGNLPHATSWRKAIRRDVSGAGKPLTPDRDITGPALGLSPPGRYRWTQSLERSEAEQERAALEEEAIRTVPDDIEHYIKRIEDSGHAVFEDEDGGIIIAREPEGAEVARIFDSGNKGRERYAVEWLPASGHKGTHLYDTIEHILSGQVRTTDGSETHIGQPTLQLEQ